MSQLAAMQAYSLIFTRGGFGRQARIDHPAAIRMKRPFECLSLCSGDSPVVAGLCLLLLAALRLTVDGQFWLVQNSAQRPKVAFDS